MDKLTVLLLSSSFLRTLFFSKSKSPLLYQVAVFLYHTRQYLARVLTWQVWNEFWLVFVLQSFHQNIFSYSLHLLPKFYLQTEHNTTSSSKAHNLHDDDTRLCHGILIYWWRRRPRIRCFQLLARRRGLQSPGNSWLKIFDDWSYCSVNSFDWRMGHVN